MREYAFTLSAHSAPVGTVVFRIANDGKAPYNFSIAVRSAADLAPGISATLSVDFATAVRHQTVLVRHGKTAVLDVTLRRGRYRYFCSIAGHAAKGMEGVLVAT